MKTLNEQQSEEGLDIPTFLKREKKNGSVRKISPRASRPSKGKKASTRKTIEYKIPSKPKDHPIHPDTVVEWIAYQRAQAIAYGKIGRSYKSSPDEKLIALRKEADAKAYIKEMNHYLRTGDWISNVWGQDGSNRTLWRKVAA